MLPIIILAVANGKQAWEYGEVFWEEGLANFFFVRDDLVRNYELHPVWNCYHRRYYNDKRNSKALQIAFFLFITH